MSSNSDARWILQTATGNKPVLCLPREVYERLGELIEITTYSDQGRVFLDPVTKQRHDSVEYYERAYKEIFS